MHRWIFIMNSENSIRKEWKTQPSPTATTTATTIIINNKSFHISSSYELLSFSIFNWRNEWFSFPFVWFCFVIICFRSNDSIYVMWCGSIHINVWTVYNISFSFFFIFFCFFLFGKIRIILKHIISTQRFFLCNRLHFCFYFFSFSKLKSFRHLFEVWSAHRERIINKKSIFPARETRWKYIDFGMSYDNSRWSQFYIRRYS